LTLVPQSAILKLHIWESSLTVRLLTPHMKTRKYGGEDGTEKFTRKILKLFENYK
jgi:hypothetical protein